MFLRLRGRRSHHGGFCRSCLRRNQRNLSMYCGNPRYFVIEKQMARGTTQNHLELSEKGPFASPHRTVRTKLLPASAGADSSGASSSGHLPLRRVTPRRETLLVGLRPPRWVSLLVVTLLIVKCPPRRIPPCTARPPCGGSTFSTPEESPAKLPPHHGARLTRRPSPTRTFCSRKRYS